MVTCSARTLPSPTPSTAVLIIWWSIK
jgi:hypothetical protein